MRYSYLELSKMIDHSLLNPTLTESQLNAGIQLAIAYDVASVCIMPYYHRRLVEQLNGCSVKPSSVVGFPHGGHTTKTKLLESEQLIEEGCVELDMVINISRAVSGDWSYVTREIESIVSMAHAAQRQVKVIFENCYLNEEQKIRLCKICCDAGADWVKTSTGYGTGGATMEDLRLMLAQVRPPVQVKAAGGVRDYAALVEVKGMGVTRVGASRTAEMLDEARRQLNLDPIQIASTSPQATGY